MQGWCTAPGFSRILFYGPMPKVYVDSPKFLRNTNTHSPKAIIAVGFGLGFAGLPVGADKIPATMYAAKTQATPTNYKKQGTRVFGVTAFHD